jgi:hypothetical protein
VRDSSFGFQPTIDATGANEVSFVLAALILACAVGFLWSFL